MRFHIDTLLGLHPDETELPLPADEEEKSSWMYTIDISSLDVNTSLSSQTQHQANVDPHFPYPNGPGHIDSTPQQLIVMWRIMRSVGVSSFRPDFAQAQNSKDNRWLWDLSLKCFYKLVECGEYQGVSLASENATQIKKCLSTYVSSLSKMSACFFFSFLLSKTQRLPIKLNRYRQQSWDAERKRKGSDETRRKARMRHVSSSRLLLWFDSEV